MLNGKTIAVVIPAYNEASQIGIVIDTIPDFVDRIVIINDASTDDTFNVVKDYIENDTTKATQLNDKTKATISSTLFNQAEIVLHEKQIEEIKYYAPSEVYNKSPETDRIILINNLENGGCGTAIARGYKWCKDFDLDCIASMDGDGQMDPSELESICRPIVEENIDYVKGNRLIHRSAWLVIPKTRFFGNSILSILTKVASGYWHVSDTQTGYSAMSKSALNAIEIHKIYKSYGRPNDILIKLNIAMCTLREVEIKPIYGNGEQSTMKIFKVIPTLSFLLFVSFFKRIWKRYLLRDFHPLFLLYHLAFILFTFSLPFGYKIVKNIFSVGLTTPDSTLIIFIFLIIFSFQSLLFAMWMDIQDNERLFK